MKDNAINWDQLRARLEQLRRETEQEFTLSPAEELQELAKRAQALAKEPIVARAEAQTLEAIVFQLGGEDYAVELARVREVCVLQELTPVPCAPAFVRGIVNVRGEIRTIIDLRTFFDLPVQGLSDLNKVILLEHGDLRLGILADAILGVRTIALETLQSSLPTLTGLRADYLRGITPERVVLLDAARILSDKRIIVEEEVEP